MELEVRRRWGVAPDEICEMVARAKAKKDGLELVGKYAACFNPKCGCEVCQWRWRHSGGVIDGQPGAGHPSQCVHQLEPEGKPPAKKKSKNKKKFKQAAVQDCKVDSIVKPEAPKFSETYDEMYDECDFHWDPQVQADASPVADVKNDVGADAGWVTKSKGRRLRRLRLKTLRAADAAQH